MITVRSHLTRFLILGVLASTFATFHLVNADGAEPIKIVPPNSVISPIAAFADPLKVASPVTLDGPELKGIPTWSEILRAVVLTAIPDQYEDLRHWGKTNEIFDGFRVKQRGFNLRVSERKRTVKHGAWHKYKVELIDPVNTLKLVINKIRPFGVNRFQFDINCASKLRCRGDFEHWLLGVKGFNVSVISEAEVRIVASCQLAIRTEANGKSFLPDLVLEPIVNDVQLFLTGLEVKRIGEIRGDLAEGIGDSSRLFIENLIQSQEGRVVKKANEAIDKKRSSLRIKTSKIW